MDLQTILPFVSNPLPEKADLRFKIDSERTIFYNNLETDETYGRWPRSVTDVSDLLFSSSTYSFDNI